MKSKKKLRGKIFLLLKRRILYLKMPLRKKICVYCLVTYKWRRKSAIYVLLLPYLRRMFSTVRKKK